MTNQMQVTGGLGFHMVGTGVNNGVKGVANGAEATFALRNQAFASTGNLEVSGGTLLLADGATWKNGTHVTARGTGTLKFGGTNQLNRDIARLHFADDGKIELANRLQVASAEVDGQEVPPGVYTAASTGIMAGRITGTAKLRVGAAGTCLIIR